MKFRQIRSINFPKISSRSFVNHCTYEKLGYYLIMNDEKLKTVRRYVLVALLYAAFLLCDVFVVRRFDVISSLLTQHKKLLTLL